MAFGSLTRRPKIRLKRGISLIFSMEMLDIERSSAPQFFGLPYLHMVIDEDNKIIASADRVPE